MNIEQKEQAKEFLNALFKEHLQRHKEFIEIRIINPGNVSRIFYRDIETIINDLDSFEGNIYFGVAPRYEKKGKKENVKYVTGFWVDIDIGDIGHKKPSYFKTEQAALKHINE